MCFVKREKSLALPVFFLKIFRNLIPRQKNTGMGQKCYGLRKRPNVFYFSCPLVLHIYPFRVEILWSLHMVPRQAGPCLLSGL